MKSKKKRNDKEIKENPLSYLLNENEVIDIPNVLEKKKNCLLQLKQKLIDIDSILNQLTKKRKYYLRMILTIEEDLQKINETDIINKHNMQNSVLIMMNNGDNSIDSYEDFNDLDNCHGLIEYKGNEEEDIHHSSQQDCEMNNIQWNKQQEDDNDNYSHSRIKILKEISPNINYNRLLEVKEEEEENILEDKYQLLKKPLAKKKINTKASSNIKSSNSDCNIYDQSLFPDIELLDEEKLKEQCKQYGLKPTSNRAMKKQLKEIYLFLSASTYTTINHIIEQLPDKLKSELANFLMQNENDNCNSQYSKKEKERIATKSIRKQFTEEKKKLITELMRDDTVLWEKILLFKKIDLKEVKAILSKAKLLIENNTLKEFLINLGAVFGGGWNND